MYPLPTAAAYSPTRHGRRRPITSLGSPGSYNSHNLFANNFEQPVDFSAMARESCSKQRRQKENNCGSPNKKEAAAHDTVDIEQHKDDEDGIGEWSNCSTLVQWKEDAGVFENGCGEDVEDISIDGAKEVAAVNQETAVVASTDVVVYKVTKSAHRQIQNMLGDIATSIVPPPSDELVAPAAATKKVDAPRGINMNDPGVMQALMAREIDTNKVYFNNHGSSTQASFPDTSLNLHNKLAMGKEGCRTYRLYTAVTSPELFGVVTFVHEGVEGADDFTQHGGWSMIEFDPENPLHPAIAGKYGNFFELLAAMAGFKDGNTMNAAELKCSAGWFLSPNTPRKRGMTAQGEVPNMHRAVCFHKEGCNFFNGGPDKFGCNQANAKYQRALREKKRAEKSAEKKKRKAPASKKGAEKKCKA